LYNVINFTDMHEYYNDVCVHVCMCACVHVLRAIHMHAGIALHGMQFSILGPVRGVIGQMISY
jgi:hypothetical protein